MRVVAFIGPSNSGKTTLICALIRHFAALGRTVAAIKHTHHPLNFEHKGNTGAFETAGAAPVILAGNGEAVVFDATATRRIAFDDPADLLDHLHADWVFVEGFKGYEGWPRFDASQIRTVAEAIALVDGVG
jgi:molybdopterin-guanine dinucleotide biosynthesis protein MobB